MTIVQRRFVVAALMMCMSLVALDATVVGTAIPTVVNQLGGLSLIGWVFSIYLLTSTVTVPLFGKMADLYGRKPVLLAGAIVFLIGSALCGLAQTMTQLIVFRAVQGLGAGAIIPVTFTIMGDLFTIQERAKTQGLFSSIWGVSSIAGPTLGGLLTTTVGWRWVFLVNLPLGMFAIVLLWVVFRENIQKKSHVLDYLGTALITSSITVLLLGLLQGGKNYGWTGTPTLAMFAASALLLAAFIWVELRAAEPVMPPQLFKRRIIAVACLGSLVAGAVQYGVSSYVPLFAQGVHGGTAFQAGLLLAPMLIGWPISSVLAGPIILRIGFFPVALAGAFFVVVGAVILGFLAAASSLAVAMVAVFVVGFGMGFAFTSFQFSVQNAVPWQERGIATASTQFSRNIGGSVSTAILGTVLTSQLAQHLSHIPGVDPVHGANALLDKVQRAALPPDILAAMENALGQALHVVFIAGAAISVFMLAIVWFFPRGKVSDLAHQAGPQGAAAPAGATTPPVAVAAVAGKQADGARSARTGVDVGH